MEMSPINDDYLCASVSALVHWNWHARAPSFVARLSAHFSFRLSAHMKDYNESQDTDIKMLLMRQTNDEQNKTTIRTNIDTGQAIKQHAQNSLGIQKSITLQ